MTLSEAPLRVSGSDRDEATAFLLRDRTWGAYALGYLDPEGGLLSDVWTTQQADTIDSLVLLTRLPQLLSLFATGNPEGVATILGALPELPISGVFSARAETLAAIEGRVRVTTAYQMRRMRTDRKAFRPRRVAGVVRLGFDQLEPVKRLYGLWTDSHQLPDQLRRGVYFGVFAGQELVAVAGTHCVSVRHGVGAVGNVLTSPSYRNRGLAATTTTAVVEELFKVGCQEVILNVRQGNDAALATYHRLGFIQYCTFVEGVFHSDPSRA